MLANEIFFSQQLVCVCVCYDGMQSSAAQNSQVSWVIPIEVLSRIENDWFIINPRKMFARLQIRNKGMIRCSHACGKFKTDINFALKHFHLTFKCQDVNTKQISRLYADNVKAKESKMKQHHPYFHHQPKTISRYTHISVHFDIFNKKIYYCRWMKCFIIEIIQLVYEIW